MSSSIHEGIIAISHEPANHPIVKRFFRFAAAVAVIPILVYLIVSQIASSLVPAKSGFLSPPILGGLAAILSLNIIAGTFAFLAVKERLPPQERILSDNEAEERDEDDSIVQEDHGDHAKTE